MYHTASQCIILYHGGADRLDRKTYLALVKDIYFSIATMTLAPEV